ncbi:MAG: nucleotidyltransferase family protein [Candidatus Omnitrophica bacterium]|jgi:glucose-1-phosphate thymidylyltransferase|nr:nucleotidyltransferase family protein [Candidatus Omnitrophota bacterium]MDD3274453.1 nucleotidyltransferase family protein [Candidatus Omnitrophota bacterium]
MKALILAAGYATRLYPLTKKYPKPLLEVKGRPIINYLIEKINRIRAVDEIFVVTNNKFIGEFRKWSKTVKSPKKITLVNDLTRSNRDRLGAIGDVGFTVERKGIKEDLLVLGGDNLFDGSLNGFINVSRKNSSAVRIGLYRLKNKKDASRYGVVKLGRSGRVSAFQEKPLHPASNLVAMCLYYIPKERLGAISAYLGDKKKKTDATGGYIAWLKDKIDVYGYVFSGSWFDIGDRKYLDSAQETFVDK